MFNSRKPIYAIFVSFNLISLESLLTENGELRTVLIEINKFIIEILNVLFYLHKTMELFILAFCSDSLLLFDTGHELEFSHTLHTTTTTKTHTY